MRGDKNSDTPTCGLPALGGRVELGEEREQSLRWDRIPREVSTAMLRMLVG